MMFTSVTLDAVGTDDVRTPSACTRTVYVPAATGPNLATAWTVPDAGSLGTLAVIWGGAVLETKPDGPLRPTDETEVAQRTRTVTVPPLHCSRLAPTSAS